MTNTYFNHVDIARFTTADAVRLNSIFTAIEAAFDQLPSTNELNQGSRNFAIATGVANSYSVTVPYTLTSYAAGLQVSALIMIANTGPSFLNVNTIGQATIKRSDGTNLMQGDLRAASLNLFTFDGANFRLTSFHGASESITAANAATSTTAASQASASAAGAAASASSALSSQVTASSAATQSSSVLNATRFGLRNIIMNPSFWVTNPLGNVFTGTYASGTLIRDRWRAGGGTNLVFSIANSVMTISSGRIQQTIQGRNTLHSGTYTLSWNGTSGATVNGVAVANGASVTLVGAANTIISWGAGTLHQPQFEFSPTKTQFEIRPTDVEIALCAQYFQKSYDMLTPIGTVTHDGVSFAIAVSATDISSSEIPFGVRMRAAPSVGVFNPGTLNLPGSFDSLDSGIPYAVAVEPTERRFLIYNPAGNFPIGTRLQFHWFADAEL